MSEFDDEDDDEDEEGGENAAKYSKGGISFAEDVNFEQPRRINRVQTGKVAKQLFKLIDQDDEEEKVDEKGNKVAFTEEEKQEREQRRVERKQTGKVAAGILAMLLAEDLDDEDDVEEEQEDQNDSGKYVFDLF